MLDIGQTDNAVEHSYYDEEAGATYRPLSDLSDTDEADMDISEIEDNVDATQEPSSKRARLSANPSAADGDSAPKFAPAPQWSNPDPYTALPPPDANRQRKDVVQLIRKSRVPTKETRHSLPVETEDFIPCFDSDEEEEEESDNKGEVNAHGPGMPGAPTGPRLMQPSDQAANLGEDKASAAGHADARTGIVNSILSTANDSSDLNNSANGSNPNPTQFHALPPKPPVSDQLQSRPPRPVPADPDSALGTRKRTFEDEIKLPPQVQRRTDFKMPAAGWIMPTWKAKRGEDPTPWLQHDHSNSPKIGVW
jgi:non-canonical poly(A) RNA polymerase PAPD5/7